MNLEERKRLSLDDWASIVIEGYCVKHQKMVQDIESEECNGPQCLHGRNLKARKIPCGFFLTRVERFGTDDYHAVAEFRLTYIDPEGD